MTDITIFCIIVLMLFVLELVYFKIADKFNIIDKPNERSSHKSIVLRGGGIIFILGVWIYAVMSGFQYPWFLLGFTLIGGISFMDDIYSLPDKYRLIIQFTSMVIMMWQWNECYGMWNAKNTVISIFVALCILILIVGVINAYNFMDGINGITGGYSLSIVIPLALLNAKNDFLDERLLIIVGLSILVFCFFNYRNKAKCFAGDVGSVSIAFVLLFATGMLVAKLQNVNDGEVPPLYYITFFLLYGVDTILTICHRIMLHENLGEAHRKHAYQIMANELHISHVKVSTFYTLLQLVISLGLIYSGINPWIYFVGACVVFGSIYLLFMRKYYHLHEEYLKSLSEKEYTK